MVMKNKLTKHHKSKKSFILKRLTIVFGSFFVAVAIIALPTYISINTTSKSIKEVDAEKIENDSSEETLLTVSEDSIEE